MSSNEANNVSSGRANSLVVYMPERTNDSGFAMTSIDTIEFMSKASSAADPAIAYCHGTPLRNEIEARNAAGLNDATKTAAEALARRFGNGPIEGRIRAHVITAAR